MTTQAEAATDRHQHILDRLDSVGRVEVGELAARLDVAQETIRRDLRALERQGALQRVHGGAVRTAERPLSPFDETTHEHPERHLLLADRVVEALPTSGTVYLGASSLTWMVAETLSRKLSAEDLTVVTTSLDVAVLMSRVNAVHVYNIGGIVDTADRAQQGHWALAELERFRVDLALLPASGVTADDGMFAASPMAAAITAAAAASATRIWLLLDADQLGRPGFVHAAPMDKVERIFTAGAPDAVRWAPFSDAGIVVTGVA